MRSFALLSFTWLWIGCTPTGASSHGLFDAVMDAGCDGGCEGACEFRSGAGLVTQQASMSCSDGCGCPANRTSGACVARADGCMSEALLNQLGDPDYRKREQAQATIAWCCTDSNYLSWLQSAPQNQSPDGEITRRLGDAARACGLLLDPCVAVDGGTLVSQEQTCSYSWDGLGIQEEPGFECLGFLDGYEQTYLATCAATNVALVNSFPCHGAAYCPRAETMAAFQITARGSATYASMEACLAGPRDEAAVQWLVEECQKAARRTPIQVQVDACRKGDELNGTCL